ncbi:MAG: V-type ATP synthase subunit I [Alistipes sp.]|nr:V-type ATP synthase subunit I [Alistipes sp.]
MMKYNIVLMAAEHERLIEALRRTGLVDITTSGWEATEEDRALLLDVEGRKKALEVLERIAATRAESANTSAQVPAGEVYATYLTAQGEIAAAKGEIARLQKLLDEWTPWGDFSVDTLAKLADAGVVLRYFVTQGSTFEKSLTEWAEQYNISLVSNEGGMARFVVIGTAEQEINLDAQELKAPQMGLAEARKAIDAAEATIAAAEDSLAACAASRGEITSELAALRTALQNVRIAATAERAADDMLMVLEGWAEESTCARVDALLDEMPDTVYVKSKPTMEDDTPVKLKNNSFARLFELIGSLYALPKYGTVDLTPVFAPFYMLFFAICLNDVGYGSILFLAGLLLFFKGGPKMKTASKLTMICGGASALFGFYTGGLFGVSIPTVFPAIDWFPFLDFQNDFFTISMVIGVVQILIGMAINIGYTCYTFGVKNALGSIGWFLMILSTCLAAVAGMVGIEWFSLGSVAYMAVAGVALVLMLLLNRPSFNLFANFGSGLWDTYNNIAGLLSDVLSYIRLFAIGLSGGVLAQVFNNLALGITGLDAGFGDFSLGTVFQIIGASAILLVGHAINLFMSCISSFVHPMRLTFVEFFKNAGFEMTTREFTPLKNE